MRAFVHLHALVADLVLVGPSHQGGTTQQASLVSAANSSVAPNFTVDFDKEEAKVSITREEIAKALCPGWRRDG